MSQLGHSRHSRHLGESGSPQERTFGMPAFRSTRPKQGSEGSENPSPFQMHIDRIETAAVKTLKAVIFHLHYFSPTAPYRLSKTTFHHSKSDARVDNGDKKSLPSLPSLPNPHGATAGLTLSRY
jgi:hypothetical protein